MRQAPPVSIHRTAIDVSPALAYARTIASRPFTTPFTLHPHVEDYELCPIQCFKAIRDHSALQARPRDLDLGISQENIVALGNWASFDTFVRHYQRNQMAQVDFTSMVLSTQDVFFDASDSFLSLD
ncbi:hypothetical protein [Parasitella parasitica]|uniref:Uncharacterized protein n=1 Tax=Parasitella parasitica TaxID=35722 RepID=A0A0B7N6K1_9FUNG|nr:hypothetical protein [Parasitella parasitica]